MAEREGPLLTRCLADVGRLPELELAQWDLLIRQGRRAGLLGRLHALAEASGLLERVPEQPRAHLQAARTEADRVNRTACWEVGQVADALAPIGVPVVVLKGSAYALCGLQAGQGRVFADLDILVPKGAIEEAEQRLQGHGWLSTHLDPYDQRYYRRWMHEIPPMRHMHRQTNLDVHHGLLPETVRHRPDPALLLAEAEPVNGLDEVYVLSPRDMWLHGAAHLFHEGEFHNALRDLSDLDRLSREFGAREGFWEGLVERARALNLGRPFSHAVRHLVRVLGTPIPAPVMEAAAAQAPPALVRMLLDRLFEAAFIPLHASCDSLSGDFRRWLLYLRSHAIRMPPHLLLPHLAYKGLVKPVKEWREERARRGVGLELP